MHVCMYAYIDMRMSVHDVGVYVCIHASIHGSGYKMHVCMTHMHACRTYIYMRVCHCYMHIDGGHSLSLSDDTIPCLLPIQHFPVCGYMCVCMYSWILLRS